jgi:hypothetical protein
VWFIGKLGKPSFKGSKVQIVCHANVGRRGKSPRTPSRSLMTSHTPPAPGARLTVTYIGRS